MLLLVDLGEPVVRPQNLAAIQPPLLQLILSDLSFKAAEYSLTLKIMFVLTEDLTKCKKDKLKIIKICLSYCLLFHQSNSY
jgi:hypothetical protein